MPNLSRFRRTAFTFRLSVALSFAIPAAANVQSQESKKSFAIATGAAAQTLKAFAKQAGQEIVFAPAAMQAIQTNAIHGELAPKEALDQMLTGTGLVATRDAVTGVIAVQANALPLRPANAPSAIEPSKTMSASAAAQDTVTLNPFTVRGSTDTGYQSSETTSATRFKLNIMDVPVAINVIPRAVLEDLGATDIRDALKYTASVENAGSGNFNGTSQNMSYRIRGFNTPFILKNGFRFSQEGGISVPAIETIEVVKGPSSMLYGSIPPGGVVNVITKRPLPRRQVQLEAQVGSWQDYRMSLDATGPISKHLGYRVNVLKRDAGDFYDLTGRDALEVVPSIEWRPFGESGGRLFVEYSYLDRREESVPQSPLRTRNRNAAGVIVDALAPSFYESGFSIPTSWNIRGDGTYNEQLYNTLYADYSQRINDHWHFRLAGALNDQEINLANSSQALVVVLDSSPGPNFQAARPIQFDRNRATAETAGLQANLLGEYSLKNGTTFNFLMGADLDRAETTLLNRKSTADNTISFRLSEPSTWRYAYPAESTFTRVSANSTLETDAWAVYGVAHAKLLKDRLSMMVGARRTDASAASLDVLTGRTSDRSTAQTTYQAGGVFKVAKNINVYAIYSESFQPQNQLLLAPKDPTTGVNPSRPAEPLLGDGFDVGVKASLFEGRALATATYFNVNNSNIIRGISVRDAGNVIILDQFQVQSGEEKVEGFELGLSGQITTAFSLMANYTYLKHEVGSDASDPTRVGKPLYGVFDHNVGVLAKYEFSERAVKGLSVGLGYKHISDGIAQPFLQNQIIEFPGYDTFDAFASYRFGRKNAFLIRLNARNLTDEIYQVSEHLQGYPRSYQLSLRWQF